MTGVDIEEVVITSGYSVELLDGFIRKRLEYNPFELFIIYMTDKRTKFRKESKALLQTFTKNCSNAAVYGGCIRKDIEESYKCVNHKWMQNEYGDSVVD